MKFAHQSEKISVHTETEAEILSLYPDKVSAANR